MSDSNETTSWLVEPPEPGTARVDIGVGPEVDLSPGARAALERLVSRLRDAEVMGFAAPPPCGGLAACTFYFCTLGKCGPLVSQPSCFNYVSCQIAEFI